MSYERLRKGETIPPLALALYPFLFIERSQDYHVTSEGRGSSGRGIVKGATPLLQILVLEVNFPAL